MMEKQVPNTIKQPRSKLTYDQQLHVRARLMQSATAIATQLDEYLKTGTVTVAKNTIAMTNERLAAYRLVLDRTVPSLHATEIKHTSGLEGMGTEQLLGRLVALASQRPELAKRLQEALGGRVIEHEQKP